MERRPRTGYRWAWFSPALASAGVLLVAAWSARGHAAEVARPPRAEGSVGELLEQARVSLRTRQYRDALEAFRQVLKRDPESYDAHMGLAQVYYRAGDAAQAAGHLEAAVRARPDDRAALTALVDLYARSLAPDKAAEALEQLRKGRLGDTRLLLRLARLYADLRKFERATAAVREALQRAPTDAQVYYSLGVIYLARAQAEYTKGDGPDRADLVRAQTALLRALQLNPELHAARGQLGEAYLAMDMVPPAIEALRAVLERAPHLSVASARLAEALRRAGKTDEALVMLRACLARRPTDRIVRQAAVDVLLKDRREDEALVQLERLLARDGRHFRPDELNARHVTRWVRGAEACVRLGDLYAARKRFAEALPPYEQVLRMEPRNAAAHLKLAGAALDAGRLDLAKRHAALADVLGADVTELARRIRAKQ